MPPARDEHVRRLDLAMHDPGKLAGWRIIAWSLTDIDYSSKVGL